MRKYIYGPGIDQPVSMIEVADSNAAYYYHFDALGSVVALSDSAGDTVQTYQYSVYGEVAVEDANHTNPYMFTGRRFDVEIGLYYYRARYYNPFMGRFLQTDPTDYEDGLNWYMYCRNNPLVYVDPSGMLTREEVRKYAEELVLDARGDRSITDCEAMASIADKVAEYTGDDPCMVGEFVSFLSELLCAHVYGRGDGNILPDKQNHQMIQPPLQQEGFRDEYKEDKDPASINQVSHFLAFLQAGYYAGYTGGLAYLWYHEDFDTDCGDYRLGKEGCKVGAGLDRWEQHGWNLLIHLTPCPVCGNSSCDGLRQSEVGGYIRSQLMEDTSEEG